MTYESSRTITYRIPDEEVIRWLASLHDIKPDAVKNASFTVTHIGYPTREMVFRLTVQPAVPTADPDWVDELDRNGDD